MSRRRQAPPDVFDVKIYSVHPVKSAPFVSLVITPAGGSPLSMPLALSEAFEMGVELVGTVEALLNGSARPWDHDPGRVPFASAGRRRGGQPQAAPRGPSIATGAPDARPQSVRGDQQAPAA